jgi:hypothetical protein
LEVARGIFGNISKTRGLLRIFVDCGLILDKNRGLFAKWHEIIGWGFLFEWAGDGGSAAARGWW